MLVRTAAVLLVTACSLTAATDVRTLYRQGVALLRAGRTDQAIDLLGRAIEARPDTAQLHFARGRAYLQADEANLASSDFDVVVRLLPNSARAYGYRARCYEMLQARERALADCRIALALDPDDRTALAVRRRLERAPSSPSGGLPTPGERWVNGVGMTFVWIEPGSFLMGAPLDEATTVGGPGAAAVARSEGPPRRVTIPFGFWMAETECSQAAFEKVLGENPSHFVGPDLPVDGVRWASAVDFCRRLTSDEQRSGRLAERWSYDLPTEAQWEYACRAGTTTPWSFGATVLPSRCCCAHPGATVRTTVAVGSLPPNAFGLREMHGNVSEWCLDTWYPDYRHAPATDEVRGTVDARWSHVTRGGSFAEAPVFCRSASRRPGRAGFRNPVSQAARVVGPATTSYFARQGFRVVLLPPR